MADEYDAGQANGEITANGRPKETVQSSDSLGIDRRRLAEWRATRDAGPEAVEGGDKNMAKDAVDLHNFRH